MKKQQISQSEVDAMSIRASLGADYKVTGEGNAPRKKYWMNGRGYTRHESERCATTKLVLPSLVELTDEQLKLWKPCQKCCAAPDLDRMTAQRDELLAACKTALIHRQREGYRYNDVDYKLKAAIAKAVAAIANAEGKQ